MKAKCSALDVANYFVYLMSGTCDDLTNMKLNKLLYYAQGHYLQKYGDTLFDDTIEAWDHGPIVNSVYQHYSHMVNSPINEYDADMIKNINGNAADLLIEVAREYGRYTAAALRNMTHVLRGPWDQYYVEGAYHTPIPVEAIKQYFLNHVKKIDPVELPLSDDDFVGYRNEEGYLVLPKEWNDEEV